MFINFIKHNIVLHHAIILHISLWFIVCFSSNVYTFVIVSLKPEFRCLFHSVHHWDMNRQSRIHKVHNIINFNMFIPWENIFT